MVTKQVQWRTNNMLSKDKDPVFALLKCEPYFQHDVFVVDANLNPSFALSNPFDNQAMKEVLASVLSLKAINKMFGLYHLNQNICYSVPTGTFTAKLLAGQTLDLKVRRPHECLMVDCKSNCSQSFCQLCSGCISDGKLSYKNMRT